MDDPSQDDKNHERLESNTRGIADEMSEMQEFLMPHPDVDSLKGTKTKSNGTNPHQLESQGERRSVPRKSPFP